MRLLVVVVLLAAACSRAAAPPSPSPPTAPVAVAAAIAPVAASARPAPAAAGPLPAPMKTESPPQVPLAKTATSANDANNEGSWVFEKKTDPMTDKVSVVAVLNAEDPFDTSLGKQRASLFFRCSRGAVDVILYANAITDGDFNTPLRVRFDTEPAVRVPAGTTVAGRSFFFDKPMKMVGQMLQHPNGTVAIEVPLYREGNQVAKFKLQGIAAAVARVQEFCPLPPPKKPTECVCKETESSNVCMARCRLY